MDKYKKLVWKHFFKQKWEELQLPLIVISVMLGIGGLSALVVGIIENDNLTLIIGLYMMIPITLVIILCIIEWIKSNWKLAKENASQELNMEIEKNGK